GPIRSHWEVAVECIGTQLESRAPSGNAGGCCLANGAQGRILWSQPNAQKPNRHRANSRGSTAPAKAAPMLSRHLTPPLAFGLPPKRLLVMEWWGSVVRAVKHTNPHPSFRSRYGPAKKGTGSMVGRMPAHLACGEGNRAGPRPIVMLKSVLPWRSRGI